MKFENKKAIVTGANRSMGKAMAIALAQEGADVVISYRSDKAGAMDAVKQIKQLGRQASAFYADFSQIDSVLEFANKAIEFLDQVDILINNAAMISRERIFDITPEKMATVIQVNTVAPFCLLQACAKNMVEKKIKGNIINISSIAASMTFSKGIAYATSKAGMNKFTQNAALDLAEYGIRVNTIAPGVIEAGMNETTAKTNPELWAQYSQAIPLKRTGTPDDICNIAMYLLSDEANWITGKIFEVDGGHVLR